MRIEVTGETERLIQAALASGRYGSAEELIAAMANDWKGKLVSAPELPSMPHQINLPTLLSDQNVKPCADPKSLATELWPKDESPDEFLTFLREIRVDHTSAVSLQAIQSTAGMVSPPMGRHGYKPSGEFWLNLFVSTHSLLRLKYLAMEFK